MYRYNYQEGDKIGELIFINRVESPNRKPKANFRCACGKEFINRIDHVKNKLVQSCGCISNLLRSKSMVSHGHVVGGKKTPEYRSWSAMWSRVYNPKHKNFAAYQELGVTICPKWKDFNVFLKDMGFKNSPRHTIDRIDNNKGYYKENCRWATYSEQSYNTRKTRYIEYLGERETLKYWSNKTNISSELLYSRLFVYKWSAEKAFNTPPKIITK